jgi:hypothetical protein
LTVEDNPEARGGDQARAGDGWPVYDGGEATDGRHAIEERRRRNRWLATADCKGESGAPRQRLGVHGRQTVGDGQSATEERQRTDGARWRRGGGTLRSERHGWTVGVQLLRHNSFFHQPCLKPADEKPMKIIWLEPADETNR